MREPKQIIPIDNISNKKKLFCFLTEKLNRGKQ